MTVIDFQRYRRPQRKPAQDLAHQYALCERLNSNDERNLRRCIWVIADFHSMGSAAWLQGTWCALRKACDHAAPQPFQVRHIPVVTRELERLAALVLGFNDVRREAERALIKRVVRAGETLEPVLRELQAELQLNSEKSDEELASALREWQKAEISAFKNRGTASVVVSHCDMAEPKPEGGDTGLRGGCDD